MVPHCGNFILQYVARRFADRTIWNAGVIAGTATAVSDLSLQIYLASMSRDSGANDQVDSFARSLLHWAYNAALRPQHMYNILLSSAAWHRVTRFTSHSDGWAALLGTTVEAARKPKAFRGKLLDEPPTLEGGQVLTADKTKKFVIVHQYDRIGDWAAEISARFSREDDRTDDPHF